MNETLQKPKVDLLGSKRYETATSRLVSEATFVRWFRYLKLLFYLDMLLVKTKVHVAQEKYQELKQFIASTKQKYLIFAINNHVSDADSVTVFKAIQDQFPELRGRLVVLADRARWSQPENRKEMNETLGSYILFERDVSKLDQLEDELAQIKRAMDLGYALIFFTEGSRNPDAREGNFALNIAHYLEKYADHDSEGVVIADVSLTGLEGVFPKIDPGEEKSARKEVIKRRIRHLFHPVRAPEGWKEAWITINELLKSRNEDGQIISRGLMRQQLLKLRQRRGNPKIKVAPQTE